MLRQDAQVPRGQREVPRPRDDIDEITQLYADAIELADTNTDKRVKVFDREVFGFQTGHRGTAPAQDLKVITDETLDRLAGIQGMGKWETTQIETRGPIPTEKPPLAENVRQVFQPGGPWATAQAITSPAPATQNGGAPAVLEGTGETCRATP